MKPKISDDGQEGGEGSACKPHKIPGTSSLKSGKDGPIEWMRGVADNQDGDCFGHLFSYFAPRLTGFHKRSGASSDLAEEIAQETLCLVWQKAKLYDPSKGTPAAWIYRISRNLIIDVFRRERHPEDHDVLDDQCSPRNPEEELTEKQTERMIASVLALLPSEQACLFRLSFFDGRSHTDIAQALNIPLGTVKSRIRLASLRLRMALEEAT